jgi:hypothetical protein
MDSNVKSFLSNLQELNETNTATIKVPSTGKNAPFKLASISQQKELLRSAFDGVDGVIQRANILNKIITDNSKSDVEFLLIDKFAILIGLRKQSIGRDITIKEERYNLDDLPQIKKSDIKLTDTVSVDNITVNLKVPTLKLDSEINSKLEKELAKYQDQEEKIKQSVDVVVSYETTKYIDSIEIGEAKVAFEDISAYERKEIVNNLPLALNNKILDYIGEIKQAMDKTIKFSEEVIVEFDASFLSTD